jgi:hypothetical protein
MTAASGHRERAAQERATPSQEPGQPPAPGPERPAPPGGPDIPTPPPGSDIPPPPDPDGPMPGPGPDMPPLSPPGPRETPPPIG